MTASNIFKQARQTPDKIAVVHNGTSTSYADFARRIEISGQYLAQQDLPVDAVAVIDAPSLLDGWVLGLALRGLGITTIASKHVRDMAALRLRNIGCVVTFAAEGTGASAPLPEHPWRPIAVPGDLARAAVAPGPKVPETIARAGNHILLTSGTTGAYKMVMRDAATEDIAISLHAEINGISDQSVVYIGHFGLWTAGGYRWPLITWSVGGTVVIHQNPDQHAPLERPDITHIFTGPDMLADMLLRSNGALGRNDTRRLLVTGGAMSQALLAAAKRDVTNNVFSVLASTEALTVAVTPLHQPGDLLWHRIHPSREVQVVDEADNVLGTGQEGLVRIRIIDGLKGYLDDETATREFFRDGYFYPGDLGLFGPDGRLSLRGRASDVVNVLSAKIATGPIEQAMQDRLGAEGVCILSMPNTNGDDEIYLVIQSGRPVTMAEVKAAGNAELGVIRQVPVHVAFIEKFPRGETGKILRPEVKQWLTATFVGKSS